MQNRNGFGADMPEQECTCCGDIVQLLSYEGSVGEHSFTLCKTLELSDTERKESGRWVHLIIVDNDKYPIVITDDCAKTILEDIEKGKKLVYSRWLDRYR